VGVRNLSVFDDIVMDAHHHREQSRAQQGLDHEGPQPHKRQRLPDFVPHHQPDQPQPDHHAQPDRARGASPEPRFGQGSLVSILHGHFRESAEHVPAGHDRLGLRRREAQLTKCGGRCHLGSRVGIVWSGIRLAGGLL
jgi:hypothetical protein